MATDLEGNPTDSAGNVIVDFVWGNLPLQPNDARGTAVLDYTKDNHVRAETNWNGYPGFIPNSAGTYVGGVPFVDVPSVINLTTANAITDLIAAGYTSANITTATAAANSAIVVTAVARTSGSTTAVLTAAGAGAAYPVGVQVTVSALTSGDAEFNGVWTVTANTTNSFSIVSNGTTAVADSTLTGSVIAGSGKIKSQSVAAGTASIALGTTITITPYA